MEGDVDGGSSDSAEADTIGLPFYGTSSDDEAMEGEERTNGGNSSGEEQGQDQEHTFDTALPVKHSYLGNNLEELRGRTLLDDGSYQTLPLLPEPGVVLVPGQTLPLTVFYPSTISMLRRTISTDRTFGVVCIRYVGADPPRLADVGTTAEIYEFQGEDDTTCFKIKAKGRQRFKIIESRRQIDGNITARVRILPEVMLPDPLMEVRITSLDRNRHTNPLRKRAFRNRDAVSTRWPAWVHSQYDCHLLVKKVMVHLAHLQLGRNNAIPADPVELSFWVAQCLPLRDEQKLNLLQINSAIQRLRWELSILDNCRVLCCLKCSAKVANQKDIFSMSVEGPQGTYVNSGGYVHETMTLYKAKGLRCLSDAPSTEYSWFPGYAWTIAECRRCQKHMGWKFTATRDDLRPAKFWGLCRRSLAPRLQPSDDGEGRPVM
ncbi:protein cereblon [Anabrus simplex]|uniref:protein cereblon n=1 Tax=Anabrus simplex TaxID=316456 RepID=UPI0034DDACE9